MFFRGLLWVKLFLITMFLVGCGTEEQCEYKKFLPEIKQCFYDNIEDLNSNVDGAVSSVVVNCWRIFPAGSKLGNFCEEKLKEDLKNLIIEVTKN